MATRCNILVCDRKDVIILYRHYDGFPGEGNPVHEHLMRLKRHIENQDSYNRDSARKIASKLIVLGQEVIADDGLNGSSYEPTTRIHGDVEYVYAINAHTGKFTWSFVGDMDIGAGSGNIMLDEYIRHITYNI